MCVCPQVDPLVRASVCGFEAKIHEKCVRHMRVLTEFPGSIVSQDCLCQSLISGALGESPQQVVICHSDPTPEIERLPKL